MGRCSNVILLTERFPNVSLLTFNMFLPAAKDDHRSDLCRSRFLISFEQPIFNIKSNSRQMLKVNRITMDNPSLERFLPGNKNIISRLGK